ncbi:type II toxin-antitoxin system PemK/MazF family toxin [Candidatus Kaiserbacteria bacterium]|nr:type II toxin-antitoxin system PemK/MazF family toxin [Candidatus Kaiserbacteria bacterium]
MQKIGHKHIRKGDVWLIENMVAIGHMQKGTRPHVVVTQVTGETVTVAPCTSVRKTIRHKYVVEIRPTKDNGLRTVSFILLSQSFAADTSLLQKRIGHLDVNEIARVQLEYVKYVTD